MIGNPEAEALGQDVGDPAPDGLWRLFLDQLSKVRRVADDYPRKGEREHRANGNYVEPSNPTVAALDAAMEEKRNLRPPSQARVQECHSGFAMIEGGGSSSGRLRSR
ncbi:MAG TPA: hypothetical protein VFV02_16935 [Acidimicrobiales bacterium]|nr:hypothetical protein [Acidimicrobiales bacterium]